MDEDGELLAQQMERTRSKKAEGRQAGLSNLSKNPETQNTSLIFEPLGNLENIREESSARPLLNELISAQRSESERVGETKEVWFEVDDLRLQIAETQMLSIAFQQNGDIELLRVEIDDSRPFWKKHFWLFFAFVILILVSTVLLFSLNQNKIDHGCNDQSQIRRGSADAVAAKILCDGTFQTLQDEPSLQAKIPMFGDSSTEKYSNCEKLREDLTYAMRMLATDVIQEEMRGFDICVSCGRGNHPALSKIHVVGEEESYYGSNDQAKMRNEADIIKSNDSYIFMAYHNQLFVFDGSDNHPILNQTMNFKIRGILLHENRLAVISGVKSDTVEYPMTNNNTAVKEKTNVSLFNISDIQTTKTLSIIESKHIRGSFKAAYLVNDIIQIITFADINTYYHLTRHMEYGQKEFEAMDMIEYAESITTKAGTITIPSFVKRLMEEIELDNDVSCKDVLRITIPYHTDDEVSAPPSVGSIVDSFVEITSFDMTENKKSASSEIESNKVLAFMPSGITKDGTLISSSTGNVVLGYQGYRYDTPSQSWEQTTFFISISMNKDNGIKQTIARARVRGFPIDQHAVSVSAGHLRIATRIEVKFIVSEEETSPQNSRMFRCKLNFVKDDSAIALAVFEITGTSFSGEMKRVAHFNTLEEGNGDEIIGVHFITNERWIVKFQNDDPIYRVMDLLDNEKLRIGGVLNITLDHSYFHPLDLGEEGNRTMLLSVGQDIDEENRLSTGLRLNIFNVTSDLSRYDPIHYYDIKDESQCISSIIGRNCTAALRIGQALYDPKGFRVLEGLRKAIIPASFRNLRLNKSSFDGFIVFDISMTDGIEFSYDINHADQNSKDHDFDRSCQYGPFLPSRSLVRVGNLTTIKAHSIFTRRLNDGEKIWNFPMPEHDNQDEDCSDTFLEGSNYTP